MKESNSRMGRREFLWQTGLGLGWCATGCAGLQGLGRPRAARILPGKVPEKIRGRLKLQWPDEALVHRAAAMHPFDLQGRMELAASAMTCCTDPDWGYIGYSQVHFDTRPPHMLHVVGDFVDDMGRHTDALWMIRSALGRLPNEQVVRQMARNAMDVVDDGMAWDPHEAPFSWWGGEDRPRDRWTHLPEATRVILGMISYHRATGDKRALATAREMVHGFYNIASKDDRYLWYPDMNYEQVGDEILPMGVARGRIPRQTEPASGAGGDGNQPAAMMGLMLLPTVRYYEQTGDPVAAELVTRFTRLVIELMPNFATSIGQTHSSLATASGIFKAGLVLNKPEYVDWSLNVYETFLDLDFIPDFGWTPEGTGRERTQGHLCCEACTTTDLLELSLLAALHRDEKYWDVAERVAMNQLLEGQILRPDWFARIPDSHIKPLPQMNPAWFTIEGMPERLLGGFGSFAGPNDFVQINDLAWTVQCCFGSGGRGLYDVWYHAAREDLETVRVNMQFSKRLPSALIISQMPGKASLQIRMTQSKRLLVRKPQWADKGMTMIRVNGQVQSSPLRGTYFDLGVLPRDAVVQIDFPDQLVNKEEQIGSVRFSTVWRGNAVVRMQPEGSIYPLYQGRDRQDGVTPLPFISVQPIDPL